MQILRSSLCQETKVSSAGNELPKPCSYFEFGSRKGTWVCLYFAKFPHISTGRSINARPHVGQSHGRDFDPATLKRQETGFVIASRPSGKGCPLEGFNPANQAAHGGAVKSPGKKADSRTSMRALRLTHLRSIRNHEGPPQLVPALLRGCCVPSGSL